MSYEQKLLTETASPGLFARAVTKGRFRLPPHLKLLDDALGRVIATPDSRLLVTMPPRHGKSELISKYTPAHVLGTFPDWSVILSSYQAEFAASWGRKARGVLEQFGFCFDLEISDESAAAHRWGIKGFDGVMETTGVGGALTGKGAHLLIIDDPVKNAEEANSPTIRQNVYEWFQSTAYTRLEPGGRIIIVQTRWHKDDLAGRILTDSLDEDADKWEIINLPAIAGEGDPLGRKPGEALWPDRYDARRLAKIRKSIGSYYWASLYQQTPCDPEASQIKADWLRYAEQQGDGYYRLFNATGDSQLVAISDCVRFLIADCAASSEDVKRERRGHRGSLSVISCFDHHRGSGALIWRDLRCGRWEFPRLLRELKQAYADHNPAWLGIEDEKTGRAALQLLTSLSTKAISHEGKDKLTRAARLLNMLETGKVYLLRTAAWRQDCEAEMLAWDGHPDSPADRIDTAAYAAWQCSPEDQGDYMIDSLIAGGIQSRGWNLADPWRGWN